MEFRDNAQEANGIIEKLFKMSKKEKDIITPNSKISGSIYIPEFEKFEDFNKEAMSNYSNLIFITLRIVHISQSTISPLLWLCKIY